MKKFFLTILFLLPWMVSMAEDGYSISAGGVYGWNETWGHFGGADIATHLPVHRYFEADANLEYTSAALLTCGASVRPLMPLGEKGGTLYLDASLLYRFFQRGKNSELVPALSMGYRWDYIGAQIGFSNRLIMGSGAGASKVGEPFDMIYKLRFNVRPPQSMWNLGGGICNFSPYEYERMWQPFFFIDAHCDVAEHFRLMAEIYIKESGMFHLAAAFYGITTHVGCAYVF